MNELDHHARRAALMRQAQLLFPDSFILITIFETMSEEEQTANRENSNTNVWVFTNTEQQEEILINTIETLQNCLGQRPTDFGLDKEKMN